MNAFYPAFSPACFSLLGLWLVVVQLQQQHWQESADSAVYKKASYGIALHFALPGLMSVLALVNQNDPNYWRASFAIVALGGAAALSAMHGLERRRKPRAGSKVRFPVGDGWGVAAYLVAIAGYIAVGVLAIRGGPRGLLVEEILLTGLVFLGFNAAWLLLSQQFPPAKKPAGASHGVDGDGEVRSP
jgi:hypothetical protein